MSEPAAAPGRRPTAELVADLVRYVPDIVRMFARVVKDPRVPASAKYQAGAFLALGLSPVDAVPLLGEASAVAMLALATRQLVNGAGEDVLREHWSGSDRGFSTLMLAVDTGLRPRRLLTRSFKAAYRKAKGR